MRLIPRTPWTMALLCLAAAGLALGACGSPANSGSATTGTSGSSGAPGGGQPVTAATMSWSSPGTFGSEPTVVVPTGTAPTSLLSRDLITGTGAAAQSGDTVTVQYIGYSWTNRQKFDASWDRGQPLSFQLGAGQVIPGWDQGVAGMKVGGRRELVIPPNLAYGSQSPTPAIAANDTLIFVVDLVSVGSSTTTAP